MAKRKRIKLRRGCQIKLAEDCGVGVATVRRALQWELDSDIQNLIRKRAHELGYVKRWSRTALPSQHKPNKQDYETGDRTQIEKIWLSNKEAQVYLGVGMDFLKNLRSSGRISFFKVGTTVFYRKRDIDKLIEKNRVC